MKPSEYLKLHGAKDISSFKDVVWAYIRDNGDDVEQMKALVNKDTPISTLQAINSYELEVRMALDTITAWEQPETYEEFIRRVYLKE